ncbi:MAG: MotA/TolQ/ExbB proton channel family protein [Bacillota bacterium]
MGKGTIIGLVIGFGALILGFILEHGNVLSLFLLSPAVIVIGGTIGALLISFSVADVAKIPKLLGEAMSEPKTSLQTTMDLVLELASKVKREGMLVLEQVTQDENFKAKSDPLLVRGLTLLMDGLDKSVLQEIFDNDMHIFEQLKKQDIAVFEAAGGFSPTLGIIGTVLGLIQVLANMGTPEELAKSIAVAFIATLYGVLFANLIYLPIAAKLKLRLKLQSQEKAMIIDGLLAINDLESPIAIRERLVPYLSFEKRGKAAKAKGDGGEKGE